MVVPLGCVFMNVVPGDGSRHYVPCIYGSAALVLQASRLGQVNTAAILARIHNAMLDVTAGMTGTSIVLVLVPICCYGVG